MRRLPRIHILISMYPCSKIYHTPDASLITYKHLTRGANKRMAYRGRPEGVGGRYCYSPHSLIWWAARGVWISTSILAVFSPCSVDSATCCVNSTGGLAFDSCACLVDNTQVVGQNLTRGESGLYHWVLEDSSSGLTNSPRGNLTFTVSYFHSATVSCSCMPISIHTAFLVAKAVNQWAQRADIRTWECVAKRPSQVAAALYREPAPDSLAGCGHEVSMVSC